MDLETAQTTTTAKLPILKQGPITTEENVQKKNDVKARSMLLMALPNEHLLTFNQYKDANTSFDAIQTRFGGIDATKKTQKTLLKQMYENFSAPSTESLDSIFNRLQKIKSLPSEWNTHVVVWRNKHNLDTMSFDDLYNNFKIVEQEVKRTESSNSSSSSQNMAFVSSPSSTNEVNTAYEVSTANTRVSLASTQVSTASTQVSTANLSDATVYAFLANQPNESQLVHEDLEQIHEDDLEEMDLKWQLALLSMRTRRFFQKTSRKITINGSDTAGYDKSKVECFNCHKMGHFARECRGPRNHDSRNMNQDSSRRTVNMEKTSSKAMLAIDGADFDWSYMADDEVPTNMALMAFSDSEVYNDKTCSKTCLKSFETVKTQLEDLRIEFYKSEFNLANYNRGLASIEEQLVFYKKNEIEKLKQEKERNQLKIENFDNASKSLDKLIGSQITDNGRKGVGFVSYNVVPPPHTGLFSPPTIDLSNSGLEEFQQPEFEVYRPKTSKSVSENISNEVSESSDAPLIEELVLDDKLVKKTVFPTVSKIEYAHCNYHQRKRVVSENNYTRVNYNYYAKKAHPSAHRNMAPRVVLMKAGLRPLNTARLVYIAHPETIVYSARPMLRFSKSAQSTVKRPYQTRTTLTNKIFNQKVNIAKGKFYTARPKVVNTARPNLAVVNAIRANQVNAAKASTYFKEFDRGYVTFGGGAKGGKITGKGTLKTGKLDFEDVYFVKELQFNLFTDESQVLLKVPRKNNMYNVDMKNIVPKESLTCLVAKATLDESMLWHRRLGHVNFKTINKLVKEILMRGLPVKHLENYQTCVACLKGKQHKASCKSKIQNSITQPLFMLHMDLFGPTFVSSLLNKKYCLVVTDDYSIFTWVFFLAYKDKTSGILKSFITEIENLVDKKVKIIRCDNETEFKNRVMSEFCKKKGIKREFSVARTP
ncbi:ribonuclease H-like domain-containing protein [Tanacetum coccineum]